MQREWRIENAFRRSLGRFLLLCICVDNLKRNRLIASGIVITVSYFSLSLSHTRYQWGREEPLRKWFRSRMSFAWDWASCCFFRRLSFLFDMTIDENGIGSFIYHLRLSSELTSFSDDKSNLSSSMRVNCIVKFIKKTLRIIVKAKVQRDIEIWRWRQSIEKKTDFFRLFERERTRENWLFSNLSLICFLSFYSLFFSPDWRWNRQMRQPLEILSHRRLQPIERWNYEKVKLIYCQATWTMEMFLWTRLVAFLFIVMRKIRLPSRRM